MNVLASVSHEECSFMLRACRCTFSVKMLIEGTCLSVHLLLSKCSFRVHACQHTILGPNAHLGYMLVSAPSSVKHRYSGTLPYSLRHSSPIASFKSAIFSSLDFECLASVCVVVCKLLLLLLLLLLLFCCCCCCCCCCCVSWKCLERCWMKCCSVLV